MTDGGTACIALIYSVSHHFEFQSGFVHFLFIYFLTCRGIRMGSFCCTLLIHHRVFRGRLTILCPCSTNFPLVCFHLLLCHKAYDFPTCCIVPPIVHSFLSGTSWSDKKPCTLWYIPTLSAREMCHLALLGRCPLPGLPSGTQWRVHPRG